MVGLELGLPGSPRTNTPLQTVHLVNREDTLDGPFFSRLDAKYALMASMSLVGSSKKPYTELPEIALKL